MCSSAALILLAVLCMFSATAKAAGADAGLATAPANSPGTSYKLLKMSIRQGQFSDLRWPNFSTYRQYVSDFYRANDNRLIWVQDSKPTNRSKEMIEVLLDATREGLDPDDYDGSQWADRLAVLAGPHTTDDEVRFDLALTVCAMRYISDLHTGRINPSDLNLGFEISKEKSNLSQILEQVLLPSADLKKTLDGIAPQFAEYKALRNALPKYLEMAQRDDGDVLPEPMGVVHPGGYYEAFGRLAKRLQLFGDLSKDVVIPKEMLVYGGPLLEGVKRFQEHTGLRATGNLDQETVDQLNVPLSTRVWQVRLTMERLRWLRSRISGPAVIVNVPEYRLRAYDADGQVGLSMGVTVGDVADFQTPVFESGITYIVFRPYWYVTSRILRDEIIPDVKRDRGYLQSEDMEVITSDARVISTGRVSDDILAQLSSGAFRVRQKPGPDNALGLLKVVFPNEHDVYLHDTPASRSLFNSDNRASSHGCIHLEHPAEFAQWLLKDKPGWNMERVEEAMHNGRDSSRVDLTKTVPILIFYGTAMPQDGQIHFFHDIYGQDAAMRAALSRGYPSL